MRRSYSLSTCETGCDRLGCLDPRTEALDHAAVGIDHAEQVARALRRRGRIIGRATCFKRLSDILL